jgi:hypothetical protein
MFSTNKNRKNVVGKKSLSVVFRPLSLSLSLLFVSTCVHPGERLESSMADTSHAAFLLARQCWPDRGQDERILAPAKLIYEAWQAASSDTRRVALDAALASGLTRLPGRDSERAQCRDLTLFGSPLPGPPSALRPLTSEQVEALGVVPPSTDRPRRASVPPAVVGPPLLAQRGGSKGGPCRRARDRARARD